ncbi:MAG: low molecular weight protein-tyrosine-phosphatase [Thermonemataceae bacterium]
MIRVLFVCLGNICRSPMAEGILRHMLEEQDLQDKVYVDSAGTSTYHLGELADYRTRKVLTNKGITLTHEARQIQAEDFETFDYILAADKSNIENILKVRPSTQEAKEVILIRQFDPSNTGEEVPDPYHGNMGHFEEVYSMLEDTLEAFLSYLKEKHKL